MSKIKKYPKVILVGRTNVGKSTLFNRLANNAQSIVFDKDGVTRDYVCEKINWADKTFELIDTGGVSFKKQTDTLLEQIRQKVFIILIVQLIPNIFRIFTRYQKFLLSGF